MATRGKEQEYWNQLVAEAKKLTDHNFTVNCDERDVKVNAYPTRVWYGGNKFTESPHDLIQHHASSMNTDQETVCIAENIVPEWIEALGEAWQIDPVFFIFFMENESPRDDWASALEALERQYQATGSLRLVSGSQDLPANLHDASDGAAGPPASVNVDGDDDSQSIGRAKSEQNEQSRLEGSEQDEQSSLDGDEGDAETEVVQSPSFRIIRGDFCGPVDSEQRGWVRRQLIESEPDAIGETHHVRIRTCISWYRRENLILFLVDSLPKSGHESPLRTPMSLQTASTAHPDGHRAAHILCGSSDPLHGPWNLFIKIFETSAAVESFHCVDHFGGGHTMDWIVAFLAGYSWTCASDAIKAELYRISFRDIQHPEIDTNDHLHEKREDLWRLKSAVIAGREAFPCWTSVPRDAFKKDCDRTFPKCSQKAWNFLKPWFNTQSAENGYGLMLSDIQRQEDILVQTFQILLSTITIQESQLGMQQARRTALLTWLAFIYAPLSFICGIFGMNVKEINGSPLSVWTVVVALLVVIVATLVLFIGYKIWDKRKSKPGVKRLWPRNWLRRRNPVSEKDPAKLV